MTTKRLKGSRLTLEDRIRIEKLIQLGWGDVDIAREVGVSRPTISTEIGINVPLREKSTRSHYQADKAHQCAVDRRSRSPLTLEDRIRIEELIRDDVSTLQISKRLGITRSVIIREISLNVPAPPPPPRFNYDARLAHARAMERVADRAEAFKITYQEKQHQVSLRQSS